MSDQTRPLTFTCYNCGNESSYPNYLDKDEKDKNAPQIVIKLCTICSKENRVEIPQGYASKAQTEVLRGLE